MPGGHTGVRKRHDPDPGVLLKTTADETNLATTGESQHGKGRTTPPPGFGVKGGGTSPVNEAALIFRRRHEAALAAAGPAIATARHHVVGRVEQAIGQDAQ